MKMEKLEALQGQFQLGAGRSVYEAAGRCRNRWGMFDLPDSWQVGGLCICGPFLALV